MQQIWKLNLIYIFYSPSVKFSSQNTSKEGHVALLYAVFLQIACHAVVAICFSNILSAVVFFSLHSSLPWHYYKSLHIISSGVSCTRLTSYIIVSIPYQVRLWRKCCLPNSMTTHSGPLFANHWCQVTLLLEGIILYSCDLDRKYIKLNMT